MNYLVVIWSMIASACGMLGLIQLLLWLNRRTETSYLLTTVMAFSAFWVALLEMQTFSTADIGNSQQLMVWLNLAIAAVVVTMVWIVKSYLPKSRTSLAVLISVFWIFGLLVNFLMPGNLTFSEIHSIEQRVTPWGDVFYVPHGTFNAWKWIADVTVLLIPVYVIDAAWRTQQGERRKRGIVIVLGVVFFILFGGVHAIAVDLGWLETPYMVGAGFLALVLALTWVFTQDVLKAGRLARELSEARFETEQVMRTNLLGEVASALAHELNQPLGAILGNAQAAQKFLSGPAADIDEVRDILEDIVRDDKRARDIILNMRQMLKGGGSEQTHTNLKAMIYEVLSFLSMDFKRLGIIVQFESDPDVPDVHGDSLTLQQVLINLLINAKHAIEEGNTTNKTIELGLRHRNEGAEITVRDHAAGINEAISDKLFEPFVTTRATGLGMGLAICKRIIEGLGGQLSAENAADSGACFRVWIPARI